MIYQIMVDVVDPASGEVVAEKGEEIEDFDRQTTIDIVIAEMNGQYGPFYYRRAWPNRDRVIIEPIRPGHVAKSFGFPHWTGIFRSDDAPVLEFLVSDDGRNWHPMTRASDPIEDAFTYRIALETTYEGDLLEAVDAYRKDLACAPEDEWWTDPGLPGGTWEELENDMP